MTRLDQEYDVVAPARQLGPRAIRLRPWSGSAKIGSAAGLWILADG